jgi:hypothetical protein
MSTMILIAFLALSVSAEIYPFAPKSLIKSFEDAHGGDITIKSSLANFGNPPYGSTMIGRVFYA